MILIVFEKAVDLLFKCCLQEALDPALGLAALLGQLPHFLELLPVLLLDHVRYVVHQLHFFVVVEVRVHIFGYGHQRDRCLAQTEAQDVHFHDAAVVWILFQISELLLHVRERVRYGMRKVDLVVLVGLEFVGEAERVVEVDALAGSVVVQEEEIVELPLYEFGRTCLVLMPLNFILFVRNVFATSEPANIFL